MGDPKREEWGSRFGFIMATAGFSIGLGNMWRFPYLVGMNGGGAFVLVYLLIILLIGIPLFTMEISLGRKTKASPVVGMRSLTKKGSPWVSFGWFGVLAAFFILTYYVQIMGWILAYFVKMVSGQLSNLSGNAAYEAVFETFRSNTLSVSFYTILCLLIVGIISARGLEKGIERACKILMPALFAMLLILVLRSVTLPGAMEGIKWYLAVDFSKITGQSILDALGQSFFSIGIASGGAFIYGSYLAKDSDIPGDGVMIIAFDTIAALLAGFMIFPAIFALGMNPASGESLLFITMSNLFDQIPLGGVFGSIFFLLVFFAALSSALGYFEPILTTIVDLGKIRRQKAVVIGLSLIFIVGFPTIMAKGAWKDVMIFGKNFFDFADFFSGNILMPLGAIALSLYTAYKWKFEVFAEEANVGAGAFRVTKLWKPLVLYLIPVALIIIFVRGVFF